MGLAGILDFGGGVGRPPGPRSERSRGGSGLLGGGFGFGGGEEEGFEVLAFVGFELVGVEFGVEGALGGGLELFGLAGEVVGAGEVGEDDAGGSGSGGDFEVVDGVVEAMESGQDDASGVEELGRNAALGVGGGGLEGLLDVGEGVLGLVEAFAEGPGEVVEELGVAGIFLEGLAVEFDLVVVALLEVAEVAEHGEELVGVGLAVEGGLDDLGDLFEVGGIGDGTGVGDEGQGVLDEVGEVAGVGLGDGLEEDVEGLVGVFVLAGEGAGDEPEVGGPEVGDSAGDLDAEVGVDGGGVVEDDAGGLAGVGLVLVVVEGLADQVGGPGGLAGGLEGAGAEDLDGDGVGAEAVELPESVLGLVGVEEDGGVLEDGLGVGVGGVGVDGEDGGGLFGLVGVEVDADEEVSGGGGGGVVGGQVEEELGEDVPGLLDVGGFGTAGEDDAFGQAFLGEVGLVGVHVLEELKGALPGVEVSGMVGAEDGEGAGGPALIGMGSEVGVEEGFGLIGLVGGLVVEGHGGADDPGVLGPFLESGLVGAGGAFEVAGGLPALGVGEFGLVEVLDVGDDLFDDLAGLFFLVLFDEEGEEGEAGLEAGGLLVDHGLEGGAGLVGLADFGEQAGLPEVGVEVLGLVLDDLGGEGLGLVVVALAEGGLGEGAVEGGHLFAVVGLEAVDIGLASELVVEIDEAGEGDGSGVVAEGLFVGGGGLFLFVLGFEELSLEEVGVSVLGVLDADVIDEAPGLGEPAFAGLIGFTGDGFEEFLDAGDAPEEAALAADFLEDVDLFVGFLAVVVGEGLLHEEVVGEGVVGEEFGPLRVGLAGAFGVSLGGVEVAEGLPDIGSLVWGEAVEVLDELLAGLLTLSLEGTVLGEGDAQGGLIAGVFGAEGLFEDEDGLVELAGLAEQIGAGDPELGVGFLELGGLFEEFEGLVLLVVEEEEVGLEQEESGGTWGGGFKALGEGLELGPVALGSGLAVLLAEFEAGEFEEQVGVFAEGLDGLAELGFEVLGVVPEESEACEASGGEGGVGVEGLGILIEGGARVADGLVALAEGEMDGGEEGIVGLEADGFEDGDGLGGAVLLEVFEGVEEEAGGDGLLGAGKASELDHEGFGLVEPSEVQEGIGESPGEVGVGAVGGEESLSPDFDGLIGVVLLEVGEAEEGLGAVVGALVFREFFEEAAGAFGVVAGELELGGGEVGLEVPGVELEGGVEGLAGLAGEGIGLFGPGLVFGLADELGLVLEEGEVGGDGPGVVLDEVLEDFEAALGVVLAVSVEVGEADAGVEVGGVESAGFFVEVEGLVEGLVVDAGGDGGGESFEHSGVEAESLGVGGAVLDEVEGDAVAGGVEAALGDDGVVDAGRHEGGEFGDTFKLSAAEVLGEGTLSGESEGLFAEIDGGAELVEVGVLAGEDLGLEVEGLDAVGTGDLGGVEEVVEVAEGEVVLTLVDKLLGLDEGVSASGLDDGEGGEAAAEEDEDGGQEAEGAEVEVPDASGPGPGLRGRGVAHGAELQGEQWYWSTVSGSGGRNALRGERRYQRLGKRLRFPEPCYGTGESDCQEIRPAACLEVLAAQAAELPANPGLRRLKLGFGARVRPVVFCQHGWSNGVYCREGGGIKCAAMH